MTARNDETAQPVTKAALIHYINKIILEERDQVKLSQSYKELEMYTEKLNRIRSDLETFDCEQYKNNFINGKIKDAYALFDFVKKEFKIADELEKIRKKLNKFLSRSVVMKAQANGELDRVKKLEALNQENSKKWQSIAVFRNSLCLLKGYGEYSKLYEAYMPPAGLTSLEEIKRHSAYCSKIRDQAKCANNIIKNQDLSGLHVSNLDFSHILMRNTNLQNAKLVNCLFRTRFNEMNLCGADLSTCMFGSKGDHQGRSFIKIKIDEHTKLNWQEYGADILRSNFLELSNNEEYLRDLAAKIAAHNSSVITGQLMVQLIESLGRLTPAWGETEAALLLRKKHRAKLVVTCLLSSCADPISLLSFETLATQTKHFLRKERHWFHWSCYGNTTSWNTILGAVQARLRSLDAQGLRPEQGVQYNTLMSTASRRCFFTSGYDSFTPAPVSPQVVGCTGRN